MHPVQSVKIKHPFFWQNNFSWKKKTNPKRAHISIDEPPPAPTEGFYQKIFTVLTSQSYDTLLLPKIVIWSYLSSIIHPIGQHHIHFLRILAN